MRKSRFKTEQIVKILQMWDAGGKPSELCRQHGITETTLYRWKRKHGGTESIARQHGCSVHVDHRK
jgi:putative transposase